MQLKGLRTVIFPTSDLDAEKAWWTEVLGFPPYFDEPFYVGFNVAGDELGLVPDLDAAEGAHVYFAVDDVPAALAEAVGRGASVHTAPEDVGAGIVTALVRSPRGAIVGLISNPNDNG